MNPTHSSLLSTRSLFLLAMLASTVFTFTGLPDQGMFFFDEARSLVEARELRWNLQNSIRTVAPFLANLIPAPPAHSSVVIGEMSKPAMLLLHALLGESMAIAALFQGLVGLACVALMVIIAGRVADLADIPSGVPDREMIYVPALTGLLCALSPAHIFFSRLLLPDVEALFFLLLVLLVAIRRVSTRVIPTRDFMIMGLLSGIGFLFHPRFGFFMPMLLLFVWFRAGSLRAVVRLAAGFLIPLVAAWAAFEVMKMTNAAHDGSWGFGSYADRMRHYLTIARGSISFSRLSFGIAYIGMAEGWGIFPLFLAGAWYLVRRKNCVGIFFALLAFYLLAVATLYEQTLYPDQRLGRMVYPAIPFIALVAAAGVCSLFRTRAGILFSITCLAAILLQRAPLLGEFPFMLADQEHVIRQALRRAAAPRVISDQPYHAIYFLGHDSYAARMSPRTDTLLVIAFNDQPLSESAPPGMFPIAHIERSTYLASRLQPFEEFQKSPSLFPRNDLPPLTDLYLLSPDLVSDVSVPQQGMTP